jgi:hypothetical protein
MSNAGAGTAAFGDFQTAQHFRFRLRRLQSRRVAPARPEGDLAPSPPRSRPRATTVIDPARVRRTVEGAALRTREARALLALELFSPRGCPRPLTPSARHGTRDPQSGRRL